MNKLHEPPLKAEDLPPADNPFLYGWRTVYHQRPDGTEYSENIPLTRLDVLHPQEDYVISEASLHAIIRAYLLTVFRYQLSGVADALVLSDTLIYWGVPQYPSHSPDISVFRGLREQRPNWPSFDAVEQGIRPSLVLEIVSPHVRENDVGDKLLHYHDLELAHYVILDRKRWEDPWTLRGYDYTPEAYRPMTPDPAGRLWLQDVEAWIGVDGDRVLCYDKTGAELGDYEETRRTMLAAKAQAKAEKARAEAEDARAEEADARAEEAAARAEAEKQRAEAEKARADAEAERAEAEKQRAEAERQRADALLETERRRAAAMEAALREEIARLRGENKS